MSAMKQVDIVIQDYVGIDDHGNCCDSVLYDNIVQECNRYYQGNMPLDKLSKDAQWCIEEADSVLRHGTGMASNYDERSDN